MKRSQGTVKNNWRKPWLCVRRKPTCFRCSFQIFGVLQAGPLCPLPLNDPLAGWTAFFGRHCVTIGPRHWRRQVFKMWWHIELIRSFKTNNLISLFLETRKISVILNTLIQCFLDTLWLPIMCRTIPAYTTFTAKIKTWQFGEHFSNSLNKQLPWYLSLTLNSKSERICLIVNKCSFPTMWAHVHNSSDFMLILQGLGILGYLSIR